MCTSENRNIKKIFNTKPEGTRKVGRPKLRWEERERESVCVCVCVCVCQDIRILGVKNCRGVALNREEWRIILSISSQHASVASCSLCCS
jgi:hypothetical protein